MLSKGEKRIEKMLNNLKLTYEKQKTFKSLKYKDYLYVDFYIPEYYCGIEVDGVQHEKSIKLWGGDKGLEERKKRDAVKDNYFINNGLKLIRISYNKINDISEELLEKKIKANKLGKVWNLDTVYL